MSRMGRACSGLLGVLWLLGGCAEPERVDQCSRICEKRELCDSATDENDCVDSCLAQMHYSREYMNQWTHCVAPSNVSCDAAMDDDVVDDCVMDELRSEPASGLLVEVCRALATKLNACEGSDPAQVERQCLRGDSRKLSDEYLDQSRRCVDSLCSDLKGCFSNLAEDYNTDLTLLP